ncbi:MAG TPA: hypothetical protein VL595_24460 [Pseudonocardia sp.]|nr:hypothetical protein [Pseudonocardia sp.]
MPGPARTIGRFAVDAPGRPSAGRHSRGEHPLDTDEEPPGHGEDVDLWHDRPDAVDTRREPARRTAERQTAERRTPAAARVEPRSRRATPRGRSNEQSWSNEHSRSNRRSRSNERSGLVVVAGLVAVSAAVSGGLLWGLHIFPRSHTSGPVVPLDSSRVTAHFDQPARPRIGGSDLSGYPDAADDPDLEPTEEPDLSDPDLSDDPGSATTDDSDTSPRAGAESGRDPSSSDLAGSAGAPDSSLDPDPGTRLQQRQRPADDGYPDYSRYPDGGPSYSRGSDRPRSTLLGGLSGR